MPLLPPKETTIVSVEEALRFQLEYRPAPADVVAFSEVFPFSNKQALRSPDCC